MSERVFRALYRQDGRFIFASTPDLPGAFGQGKTIEEARDDLRAAILLILEDLEQEAVEGAEAAIHQEDLVIATG